MRKSELDPEQLAERQLVVELLESAGWTDGPYENNVWFDKNFDVEYEALLVYSNRFTVSYVFRYSVSPRRIFLTITPSTTEEVDLFVLLDNGVRPLVEIVTSSQDLLCQSNFRDTLRQIVRKYPETYAAVGEEGETLVRLIVDE